MRKFYLTAAITGFCATFWFGGVDESWFIEDCPRCWVTTDVHQIRVLGHVVNERRIENHATLQRIAKDLGVECHHPKLSRFHKHRYWGLCVCASPCINGSSDLWSQEWYGENARARLKEMVAANPDLPKELDDALNRHDRDYIRDLVIRIQAEE